MTQISEQTLRKLFINSLENKNLNKDLLIDILFTCSELKYDLVYILDMLNTKDIELFKANDYFKTVPESHHVNTYFDYDVLNDMGLLSNDGMIYGQIITSDDWPEAFNPYKGKMKVSLFYHDKDKKLKKTERSIETETLIKVDKKEIKYLNNK